MMIFESPSRTAKEIPISDRKSSAFLIAAKVSTLASELGRIKFCDRETMTRPLESWITTPVTLFSQRVFYLFNLQSPPKSLYINL